MMFTYIVCSCSRRCECCITEEGLEFLCPECDP